MVEMKLFGQYEKRFLVLREIKTLKGYSKVYLDFLSWEKRLNVFNEGNG
jgi:hypothetical protein